MRIILLNVLIALFALCLVSAQEAPSTDEKNITDSELAETDEFRLRQELRRRNGGRRRRQRLMPAFDASLFTPIPTPAPPAPTPSLEEKVKEEDITPDKFSTETSASTVNLLPIILAAVGGTIVVVIGVLGYRQYKVRKEQEEIQLIINGNYENNF